MAGRTAKQDTTPVNLAIPQPDDDGVIPEFVNISRQHQNVCVPNDPASTINVKRMAILRGAQWREPYTQPSKAWGDHPFFIERKKNVVAVTNENPGGYDQVYVLTEKQVITEIEAFGIRDTAKNRIKFLCDNAMFVRDEKTGQELMMTEVKNPNQLVPARDREDRSKIVTLAADKMRAIDDMVETREREVSTF